MRTRVRDTLPIGRKEGGKPMEREHFDEPVYEDSVVCAACDVRTVENEIVYLEGLLARNEAYRVRSPEADAERFEIVAEIASLEALIAVAA